MHVAPTQQFFDAHIDSGRGAADPPAGTPFAHLVITGDLPGEDSPSAERLRRRLAEAFPRHARAIDTWRPELLSRCAAWDGWLECIVLTE